MPTLLGSVLRAVPAGPLHSVARFTADPVGTQEALLRDLLRRAAYTEWGMRYGFAELAAAPDVVDAYRRRVPLHDYEAYRADVERIRRGVPNVIWPGTFQHFAVSSGTASAGKIIPVSAEMLQKNRDYSMASWMNYVARGHSPAFLGGRFLSVPGRIEEDAHYPGTLVGEVSGLLSEFAPAFITRFYQAVDNETLFRGTWEQKLDAIVERTLAMDVRAIAMVPSWAIVLFRLLIRRHNERHGAQARTVRDVWPNLQVFFSGGVALASYRDLLEAQTGGGVDFLENYGASEGFFGFQTGPDEDDMLLHLDNGVFYEFVRMEDVGQEAPRRYGIHEVEPGVRYALYVSTCSGLWGYGVGDVVRFTSVDPYRIVVAGRTSEMIDKYGEAVFSEEARAALEEACSETGAAVLDFHVAPRAPEGEGLPRHQWLVEFDTPPADVGAFAQVLDAYLQRVNRHYQIRREAHAFEPPEVVPLPRGTFHAWLKATRDRVSAQTKVPRMSEERAVADGVLSVAGNHS